MSASFDSNRFFEDAKKFFTELQTSIDTQHTQQKESAKTEIDRLRSTFDERMEQTESIVREQRNQIETLQSTQTQQTQVINVLTNQICALTARIEALQTAATTIVPAPAVQPSQPNPHIQAPAADVEQENAAPAGATSKKAPKPNVPRSTKKDAPIATIPESETIAPPIGIAPPIVTAATPEVAGVQAPEITAEQVPVVEPTVKAMPVADSKTPAAEDMNAQVLDRFLKLNAVKEIHETLANLPESTKLAEQQLSALKKLADFNGFASYSTDVFGFALHSWLVVLLMKGKFANGSVTSFLAETSTLFEKPTKTTSRTFEYSKGNSTTFKFKLGSMMSDTLCETYRKDPKKYIAENSDAIRSITKSIEVHCEGETNVDDSQVWIKFLKKWLNQKKE